MTTATITTPAGHEIRAELDDEGRVELYQVHEGLECFAGRGRWSRSRIVDCDACLGALDGRETERAYELLDEALTDAVFDAVNAARDERDAHDTVPSLRAHFGGDTDI